MPKLIDHRQAMKEFKQLVNTESNKVIYRQLTKCDHQPVKILGLNVPQGFELIRVDERKNNGDFEIALLDHANGLVAYYNEVTVNLDVVLNAKPVSQVCVWRSSKTNHRRAVSGIAKEIFLNYLLKDYSIVVSDNHQTMQGFAFWQDRIAEALDAELYVYAYEQLSGILNRVANESEFEQLIDHIWSHEDDAVNRLMVISGEPLPAKTDLNI